MPENHKLVDLMGTTMSKIKEMIDVNTIVGTPIFTPDGTTLIPISKCSFGFGSGGGDYSAGANFGGGGGAGVTLQPIGFLVITNHEVKIIPVNPPAGTTIDRAVEMVPTLIDKIIGIFKKKEV